MVDERLEPSHVQPIDEIAEKFARHAHEGQIYGIHGAYADEHLAKVVWIVKSFTRDPELWATAWLHDILEDTNVTREDLADMFGERIANQVADLTRLKPANLTKEQAESLYQNHLEYASVEAKLVKLADIIVNLSNLTTKRGDKVAYLREKIGELKAVLKGVEWNAALSTQ